MGKHFLKEKAIQLRRKGFTYSEILKLIPVAKSTLSLWLRSVDLAKPQKHRITLKRISAQKKGAAARHFQRVERQQNIYSDAMKEIGVLSERDRWLVGISLYWAEGTKEKEWRPGEQTSFVNSDSKMIAFIILWLKEFCEVKDENFIFWIHIHKNSTNNIEKVKKYWADVTGFPLTKFDKVTYKTHNANTKRKNKGDLYYGCLKVRVKGSSPLLRRIMGWMKGVCMQKI